MSPSKRLRTWLIHVPELLDNPLFEIIFECELFIELEFTFNVLYQQFSI